MTQYFKITNSNEDHCTFGEDWFVPKKNIPDYYNKGTYLREVSLPFDDKDLVITKSPSTIHTYHSHSVYCANKVILGERHSLDDWKTFQKFDLPLPSVNDIVNANLLNLAKDIIESYEMYHKTLRRNVNELYNYAQKYNRTMYCSFTGASNLSPQQLKDHFFQISAHNGNIAMCEYLLNLGAKIESVSDMQIQIYAQHANLEIFKFIIENRATVPVGEYDALVGASEGGRLDVVEYLVGKTPKTSSVILALKAAVLNGRWNIAKVLSSNLSWNFC